MKTAEQLQMDISNLTFLLKECEDDTEYAKLWDLRVTAKSQLKDLEAQITNNS